jgi:TRAP-type transport system large permease protein
MVTFGASTPPFGVTMFVTCHIAGCPIEEYVRDGWLLWVAISVGFIILTLFPGLSTWLPELLLGPVR